MESMMLREIDELRSLFLNTEFTPQVVFDSLISRHEENMMDMPRDSQVIPIRKFDVINSEHKTESGLDARVISVTKKKQNNTDGVNLWRIEF